MTPREWGVAVFARDCGAEGLRPEDYNREFTVRGTPYRLIGIDLHCDPAPYVVLRLRTATVCHLLRAPDVVDALSSAACHAQ
jgi:hypothetical protein